MPFDNKKPYKIVYENGNLVVYQDNKKYTFSGVEIKDEPTTTQNTNTTDSSKKQSRSNK